MITRQVSTPDSRVLQCLEAGSGHRLVVCEAGLGMGAHYWDRVLDLLSPQCHVVAYDRAGFGSSTVDPNPRTIDRLAADLRQIIDAYPHEELVLVGHSWGGPIVRTACSLYAAELTSLRGVVLVDPSDEHLAQYYFTTTLPAERFFTRLAGELRLLPHLMRLVLRGLSPASRDALLASCATPAAARITAAELKDYVPGLKSLFETRLDYPRIPTTLIAGVRPGLTEHAIMRAVIHKAYHRTLARLPHARLELAMHSAHDIPLTEPELIADSVLALLDS